MKTQLEINRDLMKTWNELRKENEKKALAKFYLLKELFKQQKTTN